MVVVDTQRRSTKSITRLHLDGTPYVRYLRSCNHLVGNLVWRVRTSLHIKLALYKEELIINQYVRTHKLRSGIYAYRTIHSSSLYLSPDNVTICHHASVLLREYVDLTNGEKSFTKRYRPRLGGARPSQECSPETYTTAN